MSGDFTAASLRCGAAIPREQVWNTLRDGERVVARRADQSALDNFFTIGPIYRKFQRSLRCRTHQDIDQAFLHGVGTQSVLIARHARSRRSASWFSHSGILP